MRDDMLGKGYTDLEVHLLGSCMRIYLAHDSVGGVEVAPTDHDTRYPRPLSAQTRDLQNEGLTRLREEEEEEELQTRGYRTKPDHPPPPTVRPLERRVDSVRNDLSASNRDDVQDNHTAPKTRGGEFLDV